MDDRSKFSGTVVQFEGPRPKRLAKTRSDRTQTRKRDVEPENIIPNDRSYIELMLLELPCG